MMKKHLFLLLLVVFTPYLFAQHVSPRLLRETQDMPYMAPPADSKSTPAYRFDTIGFFMRQVNVNMLGGNITGDAGNEPSIAVDPTNPKRIVIGWRQFDNINSSFRQAGYAFSDDGGQHWTNPGVVIDPGNFRSDPVLDFDDEGNFYYNSLGVENSNMWTDVYRITDGGFDWDDGVYAYGGDKQWMRIDRTGGIGNGNIYAQWNQYYSVCDEGSFTRSTDGGVTYSSCIPVDYNPYWGTLAIGPDGELYAVGASSNYSNKLVVVKSTNAQYADSVVTWDQFWVVNLKGFLSGWSDINPQGLIGQAWIDVDKSDGPGRGNVYVLASVTRNDVNDPADVMFTRSTNGGKTWDTPIRINTDNSHNNYQWFGTMSVAPDGRIDVVWLDTRDAPQGIPHMSALYYSYSIDHGETFSPNEKLTQSFNPHLGYPQQQKMGDYFDMVSDLNGAHLAWAATFNGEEDVYYAHITPSCVTSQKALQVLNERLDLRILPNPVSDQSKITYYLPVASDVSLQIFDLYGKNIAHLVNGHQEKGKHDVTVGRNGLNPGTYIARIKTDRTTEQLKFVVR